MSNFEWHTEDNDATWESSGGGNDPAPRNRRWPIWLLMAALVLVVGAIVARQLRATVASATGAIEQEIRTTHAILVEAAAEGDITLFNTLVSGRDRSWTSAQQQLVGSGGLFARGGLGLTAAGTAAITGVELTPDLSGAVVTASVPYEVPIGNGLTRTVTLQVPHSFRRGSPTWLYAPPDADYWGQPQSRATGLLSYTYPQRDAALVARLAADLAPAALAVCRGLPCDTTLSVAFVSDAQALVRLQQPALQGTGNSVLELPTPSLVGLPVDNDGYRALLAGYAGRVLPVLVAQAVGYQCCEQLAFFEALVQHQLVALGLAAPLGPADYEAALSTLAPGEPTPAAWWQSNAGRLTPADRALALALIDYLLTERTVQPPAALYLLLLQWDQYEGFLQQAVVEDRAIWESNQAQWLNGLRADFERYLLARAVPQAQ